MKAGELADRIVIRRATFAEDDYGGQVATWSDLGKRWANVRYGTGRERREAAQTNSGLSATFRVRRDSLTMAITPEDQIILGGRTWTVSGVPVLTPDRAFCDIVALWSQMQPEVAAD